MKYPYLNTSEMKALENRAVQEYDISLEQMMQNAGKAVFDVVNNEICEKGSDAHILIVSGKGNNGGDALVAARLLHENSHVGAGQSHGSNISVTVLSPYPDEEFPEMTKREMEKVRGIGVPVRSHCNSTLRGQYTLIIDGLFGFSLKGNPRPPADKIIEQINCSRVPVLAVDVPSGMDVHDGSVGTPCIKADYTVTLGMPKKGLGKNYEIVGKLFIGDLGIPEQAYRDFHYEPPLFRGNS